ncbi:MAG: chemotaxis protein CheW [Spirochaetaceae bacterium]|nr:chemotaxis protein CheW [Spirochaetaceae bacterium]
METIADIKEALLQNSETSGEEQKDRISAVDFKMVTFSLAGKDYAIDIMKVKEIAKAGHFTYVPNTMPFVLGVHNLRGDIISIIDLRRFFNIDVPARSKDSLESMLVVNVEDQLFGVVVDVIDKVVGIQKSSIQPPHPLFGDINIKYIYGVVESHDRLYVLLDVDRIFGTRNTSSHQEKSQVSEGEYVEEVSQSAPAAMVQSKTAPRQEAVAKPQASVSDADYTFIVDSLQKLKSFHVTKVNENWAKRRFEDWIKERGRDKAQLVNAQDADAFLAPFYSSYTGAFWPKEYAENVYKALPENNAKQICVWNPGCGKGYEAYSLACLLRKKYPDARIKIYAQDVDLLSISNAPLLTVPPEVANSWYAPFVVESVSGAHSFKPEVKEMILFEYHDCMHTNNMPVIDMIFSRDLVSFLKPDVQATLLEDFDEKLKGNGKVILGENESLTHLTNWSETLVGSVVVYGKQ